MGEVLFLCVPIAAGFSVGLVAPKFDRAAPIALLSVVGSLLVLIATGKEGVVCAAMAFPLLLAGLLIGLGIGVLVRKFILPKGKNQTTTIGMFLLLVPLSIVAGERLETPRLAHPRTEIIQTSIELSEPPDSAWNQILSIDNVQASKPMLMYIGLPIPQRCVMNGRGAGAKRTCYFNAGYIEETVTEWSPPCRLGLSIDRTHMPGRHWLGFESAEYDLQAIASGTALTRRTTVFSYLHPAWYWRPLERYGVESEHVYILRDLARRAKR